jgi:hypothetical protein
MRSLSRNLRSAAALALAAGLFAAATPGASQDMKTPPAVPTKDALEADAVQALKEMSTYLATLNTFEIRADTTRDLVSENGNRVQFGGISTYQVRRPNGFRISVKTDIREREFFYDGKQFTIFAPQLGYFATAPAPPTILQTIDKLEATFGIDLPLDDLFRWNDPASGQVGALSSGWYIGTAMVDGVLTDHYAFRERGKNVDWEIWIQQGDQPLPRKLVIIDTSDEARPTYTARLTWNLNPTIPPDAFTFRPGPDAKQIRMATVVNQ